MVATACYVVATLLVYELLKPVDWNLARLAALFSLLGCASGIAMAFLRLPAEAANVSRVCFGLHCFLTGYLILKSTFLPRFIGALMILAGLGMDDPESAEPPGATARTVALPLPDGRRHLRGDVADALAPGRRRERSTLEGAGPGNGLRAI